MEERVKNVEAVIAEHHERLVSIQGSGKVEEGVSIAQKLFSLMKRENVAALQSHCSKRFPVFRMKGINGSYNMKDSEMFMKA